jgi:hypothetical protein
VGGAARGFRPGSRRRARIAAGAAIAAAAVGGNVLVYSSLNDTIEVVQFADNVNAGDRIASADVRVVEFKGDIASANLVRADQIGLIVNQYARTFIPSGSLASPFVVQSGPLVTEGSAVVAVSPAGNLLPRGVSERSHVQLVLGSDELTLVDGRVVSVNRSEGVGATSLSVEVTTVDAPRVAAADTIHVVLLEPDVDPATAGQDGG